MSDKLIATLDKTQLSNLAELIRAGIDDVGEKVLSLSDSELRDDGFINADVEDAKAKVELGGAVIDEILVLMEHTE